MYQRILVPTDGSSITSKAVDTAIGLAKASPGATMVALSVKEPFPYGAMSELQPVPLQEFDEGQQRIAAAQVKAVVDAAKAQGIECTGHTVSSVHPWEAIIELAKTQGCDLIVMASHGRRGVSALLLGSETQRVLIHSKLPVLVVK
jgi:nucleotide-binding universal stress UspA family protein